MQLNKQRSSVSALAVLVAISIGIALTTDSAQAQGASSNGLLDPTKVRDKTEFYLVDLPKLPELPELPGYTGQIVEFRGQVFPFRAKGKCFNLRFQVREKPDDVRDWYKTTFKMYGWSLAHTESPNQMVALKGKNICTIVIFATPDDPKQPTSFLQHYVTGYSKNSDS